LHNGRKGQFVKIADHFAGSPEGGWVTAENGMGGVFFVDFLAGGVE
jgi:hypothetical protein